IQAFYERSHDEHLAAVRQVLEAESDLRARLAGVLRAKVETSMPYHRFAGVLFKTAADPKSPLNPFHEDSRPIRERGPALFAEVLEGSSLRLRHAELRAELPNLLWIYEMGIILFWVHDTSPGCRRTHRLLEHTAALVVRLIRLGNLPLMKPLIRTTLD